MAALNPLRPLARRAPGPLDGLLELCNAALGDASALVHGLPGDGVDAWDPEHIGRTLPILSAALGAYFRPEVRGLEHIPTDGPALLVGNHSGGLYIVDTFVFSIAFYERFGPHRRFHQLAHDLIARTPGLGGLRRYGTVAASHDNARAAIERGAPVLVYPGGDHETFRPSWEAGRIDFAGRQGFVRLALEQAVPIVPVVASGGQETALFLTRGRRAARLLGLDRLARVKVLPVSIGPPFGLNVLDFPGRVPLPAKITVRVLPPIDVRARFGRDADPARVYARVTAEMQRGLDALEDQRGLPLVG
ncbi:MAG TPA: lysophospholipid acyltransferase family protein [Solirubrobacteraceae bacterium]|nr:lysophospholipid acyltransferase family protein [Solirubrobacteraceae bacterium]